MPDLHTEDFDNQEIFRTGLHNSDTYSVTDLDAMVGAFGKTGFKVPLKLGHSDEQKFLDGEELPAIGWVENLRRTGDKLIADFKRVPGKLADLIRAGGYRGKSCEIYWNSIFNNQKYPRVLKAVSLLGMSIPAVNGLNDIISLYADDAGSYNFDETKQEYRTYDFGEDKTKDLEHYPWDQCIADQMKKGLSKEAASKVCGFIKAKNASIDDDVVITRSEMWGLCPECAKKMEENRISSVTISSLSLFAMSPEMQKCMDAKTKGGMDSEEAKTACEEMMAKSKSMQDSKQLKKSGGKVMDEKEVQDKFEAMFEERKEKMAADIRSSVEKEYEYKVHKAREDGRAEILAQKGELEEDIRKLQAEKRSERIEHWIKTMKTEGKLLPAEESKVRAMREWINDDGPQLKYFTLKNGKTESHELSPADLFESLFASRSNQLFKTMSRDEDPPDTENELSDAGAEVDRRARKYMEQQQEKNNKVSYSEATRYVLSKDGPLAQRYNHASN